jgi:uncharacterized protein (UPF0216 family)
LTPWGQEKEEGKIQNFNGQLQTRRGSLEEISIKKEDGKIVVHDDQIWDNKRANQLAIQQVLPEKGMRILKKN